jgi:hypothetical protein
MNERKCNHLVVYVGINFSYPEDCTFSNYDSWGEIAVGLDFLCR